MKNKHAISSDVAIVGIYIISIIGILYEENRKRAAELLCNNQKKLIKDLKAKIVSYGELVDMLEKEMEN